MIIGDGIVLGAGGETASIVVTAPTGSTVTCTTPIGIVLTTSEISGTWTFSKLKNYGTYTITATNGTNTKTQDVVVDSAVEYQVVITYKLWLYKDGVSNDFINFHLYGTPASYGHNVSYAGKRTANKIDLSKYTKICYSCPQVSTEVRIWIPNSLTADGLYGTQLKGHSDTLSGYNDISNKNDVRYIIVGAASFWDSDSMSVVDYDTYFKVKHASNSTPITYINEVWLE